MNNDMVSYKMIDGSVLSFRDFNDFVQRKQRAIDNLTVDCFQAEAALDKMDKSDSGYLQAEEKLIENQLLLVKLRCDFDYDTKHTLAFREPTMTSLIQ